MALGLASLALATCAPQPRAAGDAGPRDTASREIQRLVSALDDGADPLRGDVTPAALALAERGIEIIPHLRAALASEALGTRLHAETALSKMIGRICGFVEGSGWTVPGGQRRSQAIWRRNGAYQAAGPAAARDASIEAWMRWYDVHAAAGAGAPCAADEE